MDTLEDRFEDIYGDEVDARGPADPHPPRADRQCPADLYRCRFRPGRRLRHDHQHRRRPRAAGRRQRQQPGLNAAGSEETMRKMSRRHRGQCSTRRGGRRPFPPRRPHPRRLHARLPAARRRRRLGGDRAARRRGDRHRHGQCRPEPEGRAAPRRRHHQRDRRQGRRLRQRGRSPDPPRRRADQAPSSPSSARSSPRLGAARPADRRARRAGSAVARRCRRAGKHPPHRPDRRRDPALRRQSEEPRIAEGAAGARHRAARRGDPRARGAARLQGRGDRPGLRSSTRR